MFRCAVAVLLLSICAAAPQAKRPPRAPLAPFNGTFEQACQRALDRNVPVLVFAFAEKEKATEHDDVTKLRKSVLDDESLADAALYAVPVLACNGVHASVEVEVDDHGTKVKRQRCEAYRTETCKTHQQLFDSVYRAYNRDGELRSPAVFVLAPDRSVLYESQTGESPALTAVIGAISAARTKLGEGLTEQQLIDVRDAGRRGKAEADAARWGTAYVAWAQVLAITQRTKYADEAREQQGKALAAMNKLKDEALEWLKGERMLDGYKRLLELDASDKGTPLEKEIPKLIKAAEADKRSKDVIAAYKRELEADALWREAQTLLASKQDKQAETKIRLVIRKYGDTPAGVLARSKYAAWAADEDAKKKNGAD